MLNCYVATLVDLLTILSFHHFSVNRVVVLQLLTTRDLVFIFAAFRVQQRVMSAENDTGECPDCGEEIFLSRLSVNQELAWEPMSRVDI